MRERQQERVSHTHTQEPVKGQRLVLPVQDNSTHMHTRSVPSQMHARPKYPCSELYKSPATCVNVLAHALICTVKLVLQFCVFIFR